MIPVCNTNQIRECDRVTIEEIGMPGIILMENASRAAAGIAIELFDDDVSGMKIKVFAGKGNNGGDGFAVARHLQNLDADTKVFLIGKESDLRGDAAVNCYLYKKVGGVVTEISSEDQLSQIDVEVDLIVDALLGTGFKGEVRGLFCACIDLMNTSPAAILAIDMPSGASSETGQTSRHTVKADITVTFGLTKQGLYLPPAREAAGEVYTADIGIPGFVVKGQNIKTHEVEASDVTTALPERQRDSHKGDMGHVLVIGGSKGMSGAAMLAARASLRAGCGLVKLAIPASLNAVCETALPEVMTVPLPETEDGCPHPDGLGTLRKHLQWADVVALGPGMGENEKTAALIESLLPEIKVPLVIDADGLNHLSRRSSLLKKLPDRTILTPHPGEFKRLGKLEDDWSEDRISALRKMAEELACTIVLKGSPTMTCSPGGDLYFNPTGNPGMATGGSGDVLTGVIAGLAAQGMDATEAAWSGVFLHGRSGDIGADKLGERSLNAGDLIDFLSEGFQSLSRS